MIITIIFAVMLVLGIIVGLCRKRINDFDLETDLEFIEMLLIVIGSGALTISLTIIILSHAVADNAIQQNKINYDGLCKRYEIIESEYEDVSKSDVIADITAWNIEVYNIKYWTENPWTNWFNPKSIADNLEYIQLE